MSALNRMINVHRTVLILLDHMYVAAMMGMSFTVMDDLAMVHYNFINCPLLAYLLRMACFKCAYTIIIYQVLNTIPHSTALQGAPFQITIILPDDVQCSFYVVSII